jgi:hypothetical protein
MHAKFGLKILTGGGSLGRQSWLNNSERSMFCGFGLDLCLVRCTLVLENTVLKMEMPSVYVHENCILLVAQYLHSRNAFPIIINIIVIIIIIILFF